VLVLVRGRFGTCLVLYDRSNESPTMHGQQGVSGGGMFRICYEQPSRPAAHRT
jgi:hypothetical protein